MGHELDNGRGGVVFLYDHLKDIRRLGAHLVQATPTMEGQSGATQQPSCAVHSRYSSLTGDQLSDQVQLLGNHPMRARFADHFGRYLPAAELYNEHNINFFKFER